ncbi:MAG: hypothetical protein ABIP30_13500 [Ferruginibacter sp.]
MRVSIISIFFVLTKFAVAQDSTTIFIAAGQAPSEMLTFQKIFKYPHFIEGNIFFKDGSTTNAPLNYNYLLGEIMFISPKSDTLAIAKNQMSNLKTVIIGSDTFLYLHQYVELVTQNQPCKLLQSQRFKVIRREKIGAYNQPSATTAIDSYETFSPTYGVPEINLKIRENITLSLRTNYYFGNDNNLLLPANRKNIYKVYPQKKGLIDAYLNANTVNYNSGNDLIKLFTYLGQDTP